jgi:hypothetical protein
MNCIQQTTIVERGNEADVHTTDHTRGNILDFYMLAVCSLCALCVHVLNMYAACKRVGGFCPPWMDDFCPPCTQFNAVLQKSPDFPFYIIFLHNFDLTARENSRDYNDTKKSPKELKAKPQMDFSRRLNTRVGLFKRLF